MAALGPVSDTAQRLSAHTTREERILRAFFRGDALTFANPAYRRAASRLMETLLQDDLAAGDLTASSLGIGTKPASASILAREDGVIAGLAEIAALYGKHNIAVAPQKRDGDAVRAGETMLRVQGDQTTLLMLERTGLNLLQRMSGIATAARNLQDRLRRAGSATRVVGTRKTPWGLLDKRALHLGGVGTHRLGLADAILIKNNHLALIANKEEEAAPRAIEKAWAMRDNAAFIEVEVRSEAAARAASRTFRRLQEAARDYPCVLMLDNMTPKQIGNIIAALRDEDLWNDTLVEASGGISESNLEEYGACGADVISIGALTHSARALDLSQRIE